jgi:FkbM family methyltransferase
MLKKIIVKLKGFLHIPYVKSDHDFLKTAPLKISGLFSDIRTGAPANEISFLYKNKNRLFARLYPSSDLMVLKQVIIDKEYSAVVDYFKDNEAGHESLTIIDAGANVGYSTFYFKEHFPKAVIVCIEPDDKNETVLRRNLAPFIEDKTAFVYKHALMGEADKHMAINNDFRDGRDWSVSVSESETETGLKSITVGEIMQANGWDKLDILKIDIEGAERFIFQENIDLSFLSKVKVLALEIHDEYNIRPQVYSILRNYDFVITNFGETSFCFNKNFLKN